MYTELPTIETSTPADRLRALQDAKKLMSGAEPGGFAAMFTASASTPGPGREAIDGFIRLAEYITTGHDYKDTHPEGKRRPLIKNTHVTVMAPGMPDQEDIEHLLGHIKDGSFEEFMEDMMKQAHEGAGEPTEGDGDAPEKDGSE
jgi:hypothetical protein